MRHSHPKLQRLRRCTSLEWVHTTNDNSDDIDDNRMVIRVGEEYELVCILEGDPEVLCAVSQYFPSMKEQCQCKMVVYQRFLIGYGKVADIYLKTGRQDVWLEMQWYYRKVDLEDEDVDLARCVGEYELVLSNHTSVVDIRCVEDHATILPYNEGDLEQPQIPIRTLYNRWTIDVEFSKHRNVVYMEGVNVSNSQNASNDTAGSIRSNVKAGLPSNFRDIDFDPQFMSLLTMPIRRGGSCGIVGNGSLIVQAIALIEQARTLGRLPDGWKDIMQKAVLPATDEIIPRY
ncbi:hypothetical protein DFJ58DRAFT_731729 [Suillus subalutaceus]|uniref:uncharacterized protein n=1 Tax=Suillus subalutaceus TaxID=48586 RepID=UPI001B86642F|nr:uncharacterized protein DFJ58DRAFT_731729 [Suillus subalutaceus]KAG1843313.1 hypothetical protein DFJ58DRAFT_731729 [Suillus subalutaceus]